jgi:hypothetical protein
MLVDVVQLWHLGERRPKADVRSAAPVRGVLQLDPVRPGWHRGKRNAPLLAGLLVPDTCQWALPPLDQARIERIRGPHLYIVGVEEAVQYRRLIKTYPQAWWCRLVFGQAAAADPAPAAAVTIGEQQPEVSAWLRARAQA